MRWTEFAVKEARQTLRAWEARVGRLQPPIAVDDLADLLYLLAIDSTHELPNTLAGRLYVEQRIIEVRQSDPLRRQRFTIAHEIGHYRLHVVAEKIQQNNFSCHEGAISDSGAEQAQRILPGLSVGARPLAAALSDQEVRRLEIEANAFAAELLMPAQLVERAVEHYGKDSASLATLFDVSPQAMQYRLEKLMLVARPGPQASFLDGL